MFDRIQAVFLSPSLPPSLSLSLSLSLNLSPRSFPIYLLIDIYQYIHPSLRLSVFHLIPLHFFYLSSTLSPSPSFSLCLNLSLSLSPFLLVIRTTTTFSSTIFFTLIMKEPLLKCLTHFNCFVVLHCSVVLLLFFLWVQRFACFQDF